MTGFVITQRLEGGELAVEQLGRHEMAGPSFHALIQKVKGPDEVHEVDIGGIAANQVAVGAL